MPLDSYSPLTQEVFGLLHNNLNLTELELSFGSQLRHLLLKLSQLIII